MFFLFSLLLWASPAWERLNWSRSSSVSMPCLSPLMSHGIIQAGKLYKDQVPEGLGLFFFCCSRATAEEGGSFKYNNQRARKDISLLYLYLNQLKINRCTVLLSKQFVIGRWSGGVWVSEWEWLGWYGRDRKKPERCKKKAQLDLNSNSSHVALGT